MREGMCAQKAAGALDRGMQALRVSISPVPEVVHYVRCCERRRRAGNFENGMQVLRRNTSEVSSCYKGLYCVSCCVRVQKEAGILERGMQALRSTISNLLGQTGGTKPEDKVWPHLLCYNPFVQLHSPQAVKGVTCSAHDDTYGSWCCNLHVQLQLTTHRTLMMTLQTLCATQQTACCG